MQPNEDNLSHIDQTGRNARLLDISKLKNTRKVAEAHIFGGLSCIWYMNAVTQDRMHDLVV